MSTQSGAASKPKKYNAFQILFVEWFMYFLMLVLLDGGHNTIEDSAGGALMLLAIIRIFLLFKKTK